MTNDCWTRLPPSSYPSQRFQVTGGGCVRLTATQVSSGAHDAVGAVVKVDVWDRARLAEPGDAEGDARDLADRGEEARVGG
jgi:hypothetical protein